MRFRLLVLVLAAALGLFVMAHASPLRLAAATAAVAAEPDGAERGGDAERAPGEAVATPLGEAGEGGEQHRYRTETKRVMEIIIHSLYSNKDVFLRELVSNGNDALDKLRFLRIQSAAGASAGGDDGSELAIRVRPDEEAKRLFVCDNGVGMTKSELVNNLGTVAKSGTLQFLEKSKATGNDDAASLIGQFGVGFYSAFLVANRVDVVTKHYGGGVQYLWSSDDSESFRVAEDASGDDIGRGTCVLLHMTEESARQYLDESKLEQLITKYSQFIDFPIYLYKEAAVTDDGGGDADADVDEDLSVQDVPDERDGQTARAAHRYELVNKAKPLWMRDPAEVGDDEYKQFFKDFTADDSEPLTWSHFRGEGEVEFRTLLFVPSHAPHDLFDADAKGGKQAVKLYVRRVLVTDKVGEKLLPRWLNFVRGIVDSNDLPMNVGREMLQQHRAMSLIRKKLVHKTLELLRRLVDESDAATLDSFWSSFGKSVKLGIVDDAANRAKIAKLLRFKTSKSGGEWASLGDYVQRMKPGQRHIYFITGGDQATVEKSPLLERLRQRDYEVVFMTEPIDEYMLHHLFEYDGKMLVSAAREGLKFGDEDDKADREKLKEAKRLLRPLVRYFREVLSERLEKVLVSNRLRDTPAVVVSGKYGHSANMERIMKAQALANPEQFRYMAPKKVLELNPFHPVVKELARRIAADAADAAARETAMLLFDTALFHSGFSMDETAEFAARMDRIIADRLDVQGGLKISEDVSDLPAVEEEEGEGEGEDDDEGEDGFGKFSSFPGGQMFSRADLERMAREQAAESGGAAGEHADAASADAAHDEL